VAHLSPSVDRDRRPWFCPRKSDQHNNNDNADDADNNNNNNNNNKFYLAEQKQKKNNYEMTVLRLLLSRYQRANWPSMLAACGKKMYN